MEKIDTQGMSGPVTKGCTDNVYPHDENGNPIMVESVNPIEIIDSNGKIKNPITQ